MTRKQPKEIKVYTRLNIDLYNKLVEHCQKENRTMSNMLAYAFETYLKYWVDGVVN